MQMNYPWYLVAGLLVSAGRINAASRVVNDEDYRLPTHTLPTGYDLKLIPNLNDGEFTFEGEVTITANVTETTTSIVFHAEEIEIDESTVLVSSGGVNYMVASQSYDSDLHFCTLTFASALPVAIYSIYLAYNGTLDADMQGFYRSHYTTSSGETRWLAATNFQPVYARQAFPCFDEPAFKAQFSISIAHWENQTALSNGGAIEPSVADSEVAGRVWTTFRTTVAISTYLVAFVVSDFEYVSETDTHRVWARPEALDDAAYALSVSQDILEDLEEITGYVYNATSSKLDHIAIPDLYSDAVENLALINYRERFLLYKEGVATSRLKQDVATTIAHKISHQWFGNRVTPEWWNYLWLSKGFATYFEYFSTASVETTWSLSEQFRVNVMHAALLADSLETTHALNEDVFSPTQINGMSDIVINNKAASIIRMMQNFVGETVFRRGLQWYLYNGHLSTVTPDDLWYAMTYANSQFLNPVKHPHIDIETVMNTWISQKGYPLVTVTRNYTATTVEISQERFLLKGRGSSNDTTEYRWWIPINFISQTNYFIDSTAPTDWIRAQDESIMSGGFWSSDWLIFNTRQTGFYRVNYDDTNWGLIAAYLDSSSFTNIDVINRAQLIDDSLNLARAGYVSYKVALPIVSYLTRETEYAPWAAAFTGLDYLKTMLADSTGYENFTTYVSSRVANLHETLGLADLDTDEHVHKLIRPTVNSWVCQMGSSTCQQAAEQLLMDYYSSSNPIDSFISADLKAWVYCEGLRNANASVWDFLWKRFLATDYSGEKTLILSGLGCSQDEEILNNYLNLSITANSGIRTQDTHTVFTSVYTSRSNNVDVALNFLVNNWSAISEFYGGMNRIGNILTGLASRIVRSDQLAQLKTVVDGNDLGVATTAAQQAIELAESNISWLENYEEDAVAAIIQEMTKSNSSPKYGIGIILTMTLYTVTRFF